MDGTIGGRRLYGASVVVGILAIADFIVIFLPQLAPLTRLFEVLEVYLGIIHPSIRGGMGNNIYIEMVAGLALAWIASYAALAAFVRRLGEISVWHHISRNSCALHARGGLSVFVCTLSKWVTTLLLGPLLIIWGVWRRMQSHTTHVTVGYVTIDPSMLVQYLKHLAVGAALFISALLWFAKS